MGTEQRGTDILLVNPRIPLNNVRTWLIAQSLVALSPPPSRKEDETFTLVVQEDDASVVQPRPLTPRLSTSIHDTVRTIVAEEGWRALFITWEWTALDGMMDLIL